MTIVPAELVDTIVDFLHSDSAALKSCALVSRAWLTSSQYHLFSQLEVHGTSHGRRFLDLLDGSPQLTTLVQELALLGTWPVDDLLSEGRDGDAEYDSDASSSDDLSLPVFEFPDDGTEGGIVPTSGGATASGGQLIIAAGPLAPHAVLAALATRLTRLEALHIRTPWMDTEIALPSRDVIHSHFQRVTSLRLDHFAGPPMRFEHLLRSFPVLARVHVHRIDAQPPISISAGAGVALQWPPLEELMLEEFVRVPGESYSQWLLDIPADSRPRTLKPGLKAGPAETTDIIERVLETWGTRLEDIYLDALLPFDYVAPPSLSHNSRLHRLRLRLHLLRPEQHLPWLEEMAAGITSLALETITFDFVNKGFIAPATWAPVCRDWNRLDQILSSLKSFRRLIINVVGWNSSVPQLRGFIHGGFPRLAMRNAVVLGHSRWSDLTLINPLALPA